MLPKHQFAKTSSISLLYYIILFSSLLLHVHVSNTHYFNFFVLFCVLTSFFLFQLYLQPGFSETLTHLLFFPSFPYHAVFAALTDGRPLLSLAVHYSRHLESIFQRINCDMLFTLFGTSFSLKSLSSEAFLFHFVFHG